MRPDPFPFDSGLTCFRHYHLACAWFHKCGSRSIPFVTAEHVMAAATSKDLTFVWCEHCAERVSLWDAVDDAVFRGPGVLQGLFGLREVSESVAIPPANETKVMSVDLRSRAADVGEVVHAWALNGGPIEPGCEVSVIARSNAIGVWPNCKATPPETVTLLVPPGEARSISLQVSILPKAGLPVALRRAVEAVQLYRVGKLDVACVLLSAAVEATMDPEIISAEQYLGRLERPKRRGLSDKLRDARKVLIPRLSKKLKYRLQELARVARNPTAHGSVPSLSEQEVRRWMVDVAVVYEWARRSYYNTALSR